MILKVLRGLPASGKSTRAQEIVAQGNWVRLNRDLLRTMLHFDKWSGKNEGLTIEAEKKLAEKFLCNGTNVVIDDTNLGEKHVEMWKTIANTTNSKFQVEAIDTDWMECIRRDKKRDKEVGAHVIFKMALQYNLIPAEDRLTGFVVVDIDGTIADCEHRKFYLNGEKKDWKGFFSQMAKDSFRDEVWKMVEKDTDEFGYILFVSARPEDYREQTEWWLRNFIPDTRSLEFMPLIMRNSGDKRPDTEVKSDIYEKYLKDLNVLKVYDDRPCVIQMWRSKGLEVVDVGPGIDF